MMRRIQKISKSLAPAVLTGILVGTSYIPFYPWALFFCYVPLWWSLLDPHQSLKQIFLKSWVAQFTLTLIGFHWIYFVAHEFGFLPKPVAVVVLILFAGFVHLHIPLAALAASYLARIIPLGRTYSLLLLALTFSLSEMFWPMIFQWHLGYTFLYADLPVYQLAEFIGFQGLSGLIFLTQALIILGSAQKSLHKKISYFGALGVFWVTLNIFGLIRESQIKNQPYTEINAGVVQANIGNLERFYAQNGQGFQFSIIEKHFNLSRSLIETQKPLDFLIWPESAIPDFLDEHHQDRKYAYYFHKKLKELSVPLITGGYSSDPIHQNPRRDYNALFSFDKEGAWTSPPYRKTHLLIFGEYLPLSDTFPVLKKYNPAGSGFSSGNGPQLLYIEPFQIGAQICYESLDPLFSAKLKNLGADLIVNVTNDSWFGPYSEPKQHLYMTLARAIETRLPLIRSTNTGISSAIDNSGQITELSPLNKEWAAVLTVKKFKVDNSTFYSKYALLLPFLITLLIIFICVKGQIWKASTGKKS